MTPYFNHFMGWLF